MNRDYSCRIALGAAVFLALNGVAIADTLATGALSTSGITQPIPWSEIGAKAAADYQGDGLAVTPIDGGAQLRCVFQRLDGEVTRDGLRLSSNVPGQSKDRFCVKAVAVGRSRAAGDMLDGGGVFGLRWPNVLMTPLLDQEETAKALPREGTLSMDGQRVRFARPGLVEEYSVSMDGIRQDFIVVEKPVGEGDLRVKVEVTGAWIEQVNYGARIVLKNSGRKISYARLRVTDANGRELPARMEVETKSEMPLAVVVHDADAAYPIRIDPTFSDENWISMGGLPGADNAVKAATVDDAGNLYIGGKFIVVGEVFAYRIAKWNGSDWSSLGGGLSGEVNALAASGSNVYAGGNFTMATNVGGGAIEVNYIAHWNGSNWSALGTGMDWTVNALAASGSDVYAGGDFWQAGGNAIKYVAKWNGADWSALGSGINGSVDALAVSGSDVYVGGDFTRATNSGGVALSANRIAKWDGSSWGALGGGMNGPVRVLAISGSDVYAGGWFDYATNSGGVAVTVNNIAKWTGVSWSALGSGMDYKVNALAVSGSDVYAGGDFWQAGGSAIQYLAKWNGTNWSTLGEGIGGDDDVPDMVAALVIAGSNVYAGGAFLFATNTGGVVVAANRVAKWDGSSWSALGEGMNDYVAALAVSGSDVYVGGNFISVGGIAANRVARWNGSSWSALGEGMNNAVFALAVADGDLYAGGVFTMAGGNTANFIAKWNGSSWSALGLGMDNGVVALAASGSSVYAGGYFAYATNNDGIPVTVNRIAKWSGGSWSALGGGVNDGVAALVVSGSDVYAGGYFIRATNSGGVAVTANRIAKWDGSEWSPLGSGMNKVVYAVAVSGGDVYAGGAFTTADGYSASYVARWDEISWNALNGGMNGIVEALAVSGSDVYAGGMFTTADWNPANRIAKWDGSNWSALGSGLNGPVWALASSGSDLYAGGTFTTAGDKVSGYMARALLSLELGIASQPQNTTNLVGTAASFAVTATGNQPLTYQWRRAGTNLVDEGNISGAMTNELTLSYVQLADAGDYDVVITNFQGSVTSQLATLTVVVSAEVVGAPGIDAGDFEVRFAGTPGITYTIEYTDSLSPPDWQKATNLTASITDVGFGVGGFEFREAVILTANRFYRAVYPSY